MPKNRGLMIMAANSLGNPLDIPARSLDAVKTADLVIFEEDKPARTVLKAAGVHREYLKYNEQNQVETLEELKKVLQNGKTAVYMSDQGCPSLEDPGNAVLKAARYCNARINVIPGPSSVTATLSACPFKSKNFEFLGFPPREEHKRAEFLNKIARSRGLKIIMDTPYRLKRVLETCEETFNKETRAFIAVDISGPDEDYLLGNFKELRTEVDKIDKKLNFVMIINPVPSVNRKPGKGRRN
jgi:16S rRNA (cytidine1402-2'-O)-methyltransferase